MTQSQARESRETRFIAYLRGLADREDRAALAALRRSLQHEQGMDTAAFPYVVPFLDEQASFRDRAYFLVAALFASHPDPGGVSLGVAFRRLNPDDPNNESVRRRFVALLDAPLEDVGDHLRQAVSLCRSKGVPLDWERLLRDLLAFSHPDRYVQRRLAREYWQSPVHDRDQENPS
jgi:CRISPR system Cascade subunit CasB